MAGGDLFDGGENGSDGPVERTPSPFSGEPGGATEQARAKRGRPAGARNRKTADAERWYFAMGYADPLQRLGEIVTEDPFVLLAWFREHAEIGKDGNAVGVPSLAEIVRLQIAAAGELMPYLHGKKPVDLNVTGTALPMLALALGTNQIDQALEIEGRRALSVGIPEPSENASETNDLEGGEQ